jgi:hypothetical protein
MAGRKTATSIFPNYFWESAQLMSSFRVCKLFLPNPLNLILLLLYEARTWSPFRRNSLIISCPIEDDAPIIKILRIMLNYLKFLHKDYLPKDDFEISFTKD